MKNTKNKIYTPGYFIKRLRDNDFIVLRIFQDYKKDDPRRWTILVDPGDTSLFITCMNDPFVKGEVVFYFDDGDRLFAKNTMLKTSSIEIIVEKLITSGVKQSASDKSRFFKSSDINNSNGGSEPEKT
jgi:hypothetical protein